MYDVSSDLDQIILVNGGHLVVPEDAAASTVLGDEFTMLFQLPNTHLLVGSNVRTSIYQHAASTLQIAANAQVTLYHWIFMRGNLTINSIVNLIIDGNMTIVNQNFTLFNLTVAEESHLTILQETNDIFRLDTQQIKFDGEFKVNLINLTSITDFYVGKKGQVDMNPVSSNMYIGERIDFSGQVSFGKPVSIFQPCESFRIGDGAFSFPTPANVTIECEEVYINGDFQPGTVDFGTGVKSLTIDVNGTFVLAANSPVLTNALVVDGTFHIDNLVEFRSLNRSDSRIEVVIVGHEGDLQLNKESQPKLLHGQTVRCLYDIICA